MPSTYFAALDYETWIEPAKGIRARWWNAGHLLGSASIEVEVAQAGKPPIRILFSGDIGPDHKMLQPDPEAPTGFDYVICESTYGGKDRFERSEEKRRELMAQEVNAAAARKGALLIPSFAVERTQEVVTDLVWLMEQGKVPSTTIFIDSPLANKASAIFKKHAKELQNGDALFRAFNSPLLKNTETVEDSKAIAKFSGFRIIIAASGMCDAGRIRHHLKNHLFQASTTVLLGGLPGHGFAWLHPGERRRDGENHGRGNHRARHHPPVRGLFRPCRWAGACAVAERAQTHWQNRVSSPTAKKSRKWPCNRPSPA